ncbi:MAG: FHA domain-containing protein [Myxococcales bacterium]|nr:FHA domain-containing protein [Myxococcales bacterium]
MTQVELHILRQGHSPRRLVLMPGVVQVGRADDNDVVLADVGVSRRHARIEVADTSVVVEDLGSGNGMSFKGRPVMRQVLGHGDEVVIAPYTLRVELRRETGAAAEITDGRDETVPVQSAPPAANLVVTSAHKMPVREFPLPFLGSVSLGRSDRCVVVLPEPASSRVHAEIVCDAGVATLRDNGSSNGTFVNGRRVRERRLEDGDRIRIGTVELRYSVLPASEGTDSFVEALVSAPGSSLPPPPGVPATPALPFPPARGTPSIPDPPPPPQFRPPRDAVELDVNPARARSGKRLSGGARRGSGFFARPINQISAGLLAITLVMLGGKAASDLLASFMKPDLKPAPVAAAAPLPADVDALMAEGMLHFAAARYFEAAGAFYRVLQLDAGHADARRMGFLACEFITLAEVRSALVTRTTSDSARAEARTRALDAVAKARAGEFTVAEARALLDEASALSPDDAELLTARAFLDARQTAVARAASAGKAVAHAKEVGGRLAAARADLDKGAYAKAVKGFEAVMAADPSRSTPDFYQAEEGVRTAKDRMKAESKSAWSQATAAVKAGDWLTARKRLNEVVRIDPYNEAAVARLADARRHLKEDASELYKEARTLEGLGQNDKAVSLYHKVQLYVDDEADPLSQKARTRTDSLLR